ncbi:MAG: Fic family protein [Eubacterium sp.]
MTYEKITSIWKNQISKDERNSILKSDLFELDFVYNTCKIENNKITYQDTEKVFDIKSKNSFDSYTKNMIEIYNSKQAYEKILLEFDNNRIIDETLVKKIHNALTNGTYDTRRLELGELPGEYKKNNFVAGSNEVGASAEDVREEITELLDELTDIPDDKALIAAAYFHAKFENIHPFADGNGRTGRLLMNYILLILSHPPIIIFDMNKAEYYKALEEFDTELRLNKMIDFLKYETEKTWKNILKI